MSSLISRVQRALLGSAGPEKVRVLLAELHIPAGGSGGTMREVRRGALRSSTFSEEILRNALANIGLTGGLGGNAQQALDDIRRAILHHLVDSEITLRDGLNHLLAVDDLGGGGGGGPTYQGPGDVLPMTGQGFWVGMCAFSAASAALLRPALDLVSTAGNVGATTTIATKTDGTVDMAAITAFIATNCSNSASNAKITKLYDQSGNGHHYIPSGVGMLSLRPDGVGAGNYSIIMGSTLDTVFVCTDTISGATTTYYWNFVGKTNLSDGNQRSIYGDKSSSPAMLPYTAYAANKFATDHGGGLGITAPDNAFYAGQIQWAGTALSLQANAATGSVIDAARTYSANTNTIGGFPGSFGVSTWSGDFVEMGLWLDETANMSSMYANQKARWPAAGMP